MIRQQSKYYTDFSCKVKKIFNKINKLPHFFQKKTVSGVPVADILSTFPNGEKDDDFRNC